MTQPLVPSYYVPYREVAQLLPQTVKNDIQKEVSSFEYLKRIEKIFRFSSLALAAICLVREIFSHLDNSGIVSGRVYTMLSFHGSRPLVSYGLLLVVSIVDHLMQISLNDSVRFDGLASRDKEFLRAAKMNRCCGLQDDWFVYESPLVDLMIAKYLKKNELFFIHDEKRKAIRCHYLGDQERQLIFYFYKKLEDIDNQVREEIKKFIPSLSVENINSNSVQLDVLNNRINPQDIREWQFSSFFLIQRHSAGAA